MIEFRTVPDDHPGLAHSPLLRAALLTLQYAEENGSIGLTKTKAFNRVFVHWAVEHFDWPGKSAEEMFRYNKVINEYEFAPPPPSPAPRARSAMPSTRCSAAAATTSA